MKKNFWIIVLFAVLTVMNIGCDNTEVITINCEDCEFEIPKFEKKYSQKVAEYIEDDYDYDDQEKKVKYRLEYSSIEEAEWKMLNCFESRIFDYEVFWHLFNSIIKSDTSTMSYIYDSEIEEYFSVVTSQDGNLRVYSFDSSSGTMGLYCNTVQYRKNGDVKVTEYGGCLECVDDDYTENGLYADVEDIYDLVCGNETYYLLANYYRNSTQGYFECACYELTENGLMPVELFKDENGTHSAIYSECGYYMYFVKEKYGKVYSAEDLLDDTPITIYVEAENYVNTDQDMEATYKVFDRYHKYVWDGKYFVREGDGDFANPFLCSQLHEYYSNEMLLKTDRNLIRIDLMPDKTYRYAAWKAEAEMSDAPELVINNGYMMHNDDDIYYIFNNEGFEYKVGDSEVVVRKGKNIVGRWYAYEIYSM